MSEKNQQVPVDFTAVLAGLQDQIDDLTAVVEAHQRRIDELERSATAAKA